MKYKLYDNRKKSYLKGLMLLISLIFGTGLTSTGQLSDTVCAPVSVFKQMIFDIENGENQRQIIYLREKQLAYYDSTLTVSDSLLSLERRKFEFLNFSLAKSEAESRSKDLTIKSQSSYIKIISIVAVVMSAVVILR